MGKIWRPTRPKTDSQWDGKLKANMTKNWGSTRPNTEGPRDLTRGPTWPDTEGPHHPTWGPTWPDTEGPWDRTLRANESKSWGPTKPNNLPGAGQLHSGTDNMHAGLPVPRISAVSFMTIKWEKVSQCLTPRSHGLHSPWNSPGQNIGVGIVSHLNGILATQG